MKEIYFKKKKNKSIISGYVFWNINIDRFQFPRIINMICNT